MNLKGRLERWVMELQEFQFSVVRKPGKLHSNSDALSRLVAHDQSSENTLNTTFNSHDPAADNSNCAITLNPNVNVRKAQSERKRKESAARRPEYFESYPNENKPYTKTQTSSMET
jgi:hypothetical protein